MSDCTILCCGPSNRTATATRTANPTIQDLDGCNNQTEYFGADGSYAFGTPVKFGTAAGSIEPALDGVDAIGVSVCNKSLTATDTGADRKITVARTGHLYWADIAANLGEAVNDATAWWAVHIELQKANIYVRFV